jgi:hypothetical protein
MIDCLKRWFKDLFYDSTNTHLDVGRVICAVTLALLADAVFWNMYLRQPINLSELGTGEGVILTALVAYIYHDRKQNGV